MCIGGKSYVCIYYFIIMFYVFVVVGYINVYFL